MKKQGQVYEPHLFVQEQAILPGEEWRPKTPGWHIIQIRNGNGYCLQAQKSSALDVNTVILLSNQSEAIIRASQLGILSFHVYNVAPARLIGLITSGEHDTLAAAAVRKESALKIFSADSPLALHIKMLCSSQRTNGLPFRLKLLQAFVEAVGNALENSKPNPEISDAKERLHLLLKETPPDQLVEMDFLELAKRTHCTSRHLSRIFQKLVGMSFREKRAEVRMSRARELLATSKSKVVEVALESGFKSLSLFNLTFARRFGTSPGRWRRTQLSKRPIKNKRL